MSIHMRTCLVVLGLLGATPLLAQEAAPAAAPAAPDTAVLSIGNRTVFVFRARAGNLTPRDREELARDRIRRARRPGADSIRVFRDSLGAMVLLNDAPVFVVSERDLPGATTAGMDSAAVEVVGRLREGLEAAEEASSVRALAVGAGQAAAATLLLIFLLRVLARGRAALAARARRSVPDLKVSGVSLLSMDWVERFLLRVLGALSWGLGLLLAYGWVTFCLTRFAYTRPWGMVFGRFLAGTAGAIGLGILHAIPNLITIGLIFLAARGLLALLRSFFDAVAAQRIQVLGIHPDTVPATRRIVSAVVWMFALASAYPLLPGAGSESFKGVSVLAGILVTFGSAGLVGQAMSGLLLMYARGFKAGDFIRVGAVEGTVVELGLLSTRIRTVANEYVLVPNNTMVSGSITDFSAAGREGRSPFVTASVTIGYDAPWQRIHQLLLAAGGRLEGTLRSPEAFVLQRALNDFYVHYEVFVPVASARATDLPELRSQLHRLIQDTFWEAGQEITSPHFFAIRDGNAVTIPPESNPPASGRAFPVEVHQK
jgi:small-conductance mechanosensitive channel